MAVLQDTGGSVMASAPRLGVSQQFLWHFLASIGWSTMPRRIRECRAEMFGA